MITRAISSFILSIILTASALAQNTPAWQPYTQYSVGTVVSYNGLNYTCLQAHKSLPVWDLPDVPALWQPSGPKGGGSCVAAPAAPTGLAASSVSSTGLTLTWTAPAAPPNCALGNYTVYQNGVAIGGVTGTIFNVTGLSPSTGFSFQVSATDSFGSSSPGASISVTTPASSGGGSCAAAWTAGSVYTGGMAASLWRLELQGELVDSGAESRIEQRTVGKRPAMDHYGHVRRVHSHSIRSHGIVRLQRHRLQRRALLECRGCARQLHCFRLHRLSERVRSRHVNGDYVHCYRPFTADFL